MRGASFSGTWPEGGGRGKETLLDPSFGLNSKKGEGGWKSFLVRNMKKIGRARPVARGLYISTRKGGGWVNDISWGAKGGEQNV